MLTASVRCSKTRSDYAYDHSLRVRHGALAIAANMNLGDADKEDLASAAMLHNLGHLSSKMHQLASTHSSTALVTQAHAECEARFLSSVPELGSIADIVMFQKENFDGTGAPTGLRGDQIPMAARILRVVDEYDSLRRPEGSAAAMTHEEAMRFLSQRSARQFDGRVVEALDGLGANNLFEENYAWEVVTASASHKTDLPDTVFEPSFSNLLVS